MKDNESASETKIIKLITAWSQPNERYADLHSRVRTSSAREFVSSFYHDIEDHEQKTGSRVRWRQARSGVTFWKATAALPKTK